MASVTFVPSRIAAGDFVDVPVPGSGDNGKAVTYNHGTGLFVYTGFESSGAVSTHVGLANPHSQYLLASNYTAADVLAKLLTVDGSGSGLDADLLDGNSSAAFATAGHSHAIAHSSLTGLSNDDHTQYLLASGSRNGAATIVASGINATPLTLKMAASQTADGLRVADSNNADLVHIAASGRITTIDRIISGNNTSNELYNYDSSGRIDYGGGYGQVDTVGFIHVISNLASPFATNYFTGLNAIVVVDDSTTSGQSGYVYGVNGFVYVTSTATQSPSTVYGLSYGASNYSASASDIYGAYLYAVSAVGSAVGNMIGAYFSIDNGGAGAVGYGAGVQVDKPSTASGSYTLLVGVDVGDHSGISGATTKYAIRTQGGQVLHQAGSASVVPLVAQEAASQTADAVQTKNSSNTVQFAIGAGGKMKTNQATANTHTPSGATAKQLPIYDTAGTLLGYIPIYGSAW